MKKKKIIAAGIILMMFYPLTGLAQYPLLFRNYQTQDGLPSNEVYGIYQDAADYIWLATDRGLARFDGRNFKTYTSEEGLGGNVILNVFPHPQKGLLIFPINRKISWLYEDTITPLPGAERILKEYPEGQFYYGIRHFSPQRIALMCGAKQFLIDSALHINPEYAPVKGMSFFIKQQEYLLQPEDHSTKIWKVGEEGTRELLLELDESINPGRGKLIYTDESEVLVTDDNVLFRFSLTSKKGERVRSFPSRIEALEYDHEGNVMVGTRHNGLWRSDGQRWTHGYKDLSVTGILRDHAGGIWITTLESGVFHSPVPGLKMVHNAFYKTFDLQYPLLAVASKDSLIVRDLAADRISSWAVDDLSALKVLNAGKTLWGASRKYGLATINDRLEHFDFKMFLIKDIEAHEREVVAATHNGILYWKDFLRNPLDPDTLVYGERITLARWGNDRELWYSTVNEFRNLTTLQDTLPFRVMDMTQFCDNRLVLGTSNSGVVILDQDRKILRKITVQDGLPSNAIVGICRDDSLLWVVHSQGLSSIHLKDSPAVKNYPSVSALLSGIDQMEVFNDQLYLGNRRCIVRVDRKSIAYTARPSIKATLELKSKGKAVSEFTGQRLHYAQHSVKIELHYAWHAGPDGLQFRYRLRENSPWQPTGDNFLLTDLAPGRYQLDLQYTSGDGSWYPVTSELNFNVAPPWWREWWFTGGLLLSLLALAYGVMSWRYREKLDKEKERAETRYAIQELRLKALKAKINPHFIFNVFSSIQYFLITNKMEEAQHFLQRFSTLVRRTLETSELEFVELDEELQLLKMYVDLESERLGGERIQFQVSHEYNGEKPEIWISPGVLQPFIENSIWHGLRHKKGERRIDLKVLCDPQIVKVTLQDNGIGREAARKQGPRKKHTSMGMQISTERVQVLLDNKHIRAVEVTDLYDEYGHSSGTRVTIQLPLKRNQNILHHESTDC